MNSRFPVAGLWHPDCAAPEAEKIKQLNLMDSKNAADSQPAAFHYSVPLDRGLIPALKDVAYDTLATTARVFCFCLILHFNLTKWNKHATSRGALSVEHGAQLALCFAWIEELGDFVPVAAT